MVIFTQIISQSNAFPPSTVIIEQYRPPLGNIVVEFPASLVDKEESSEQAAVHELREETGFEVTLKDVIHVGPMTGADLGLTASTMKLVAIRVFVPPSEKTVPEPQQALDEGESIIKRTVEIDKLYEVLEVSALRVVINDYANRLNRTH